LQTGQGGIKAPSWPVLVYNKDIMSAVFDLLKIIFGIVAGPVLVLLAGVILYVFISTTGIDIKPALSLAIALGPIWLPIVLFSLFFTNWMIYVRKKYIVNKGRFTLRIKLPPEVYKSPEAMEHVLSQVYNVQSADNLFQTYLDGRHPLVMSLELVSNAGEVQFYVNVADIRVKKVFEAQLYGQYPGIEVIEEEVDYTGAVWWDPEKFEIMSFYMQKKEDEVFPIKTYIDYKMDMLPKEEQKVEPMTAMLEQMSTLGPNQYSWVQILCRPHTKKVFKTGYLKEIPMWDKKIKAKINEMMGRDDKGMALKKKEGEVEREEVARLTAGERDTIAAMERNMGKYAYEVAIRWLYVAKKGKFDGSAIGPMLRTFAEYDMVGRNGVGVVWRTDFDYNMFQDRSGKRKEKWKKAELSYYKKRSFFDSYLDKNIPNPKVWSVEELATIYHMPSSIVATPGIARVQSTRREAPADLPIATM